MSASENRRPISRRQIIARMGQGALAAGIVLLAAGWALSWRTLMAWGTLSVILGAIWWTCSLFTSREPMRVADHQYMRRLLPAMIGYVLAITLISWLPQLHWPVWARALLAVLPVLPMVWVVVSLWRFIQCCDELERRIHVEAVFLTCGIVGLASFAGGMLQMVDVWHPDAVLFWVFPAMFLVYGMAGWWCRRKYGFGDGE